MSDRVKLRLAVATLVLIMAFNGVAYGWLVSLFLPVGLAAGVGVLIFLVGLGVSLGRSLPIFPWWTWTVTVFWPGGSKSLYRTTSLERAQALRAKAVSVGEEDHGFRYRIEARISKGRRGL